MIYEPNRILWRSGDLVIHDADAKKPEMLMEVVDYTRDGRCRTVYLDSALQREWGSRRHSRLLNPLAALHDPARFGIEARGTHW